MELCVEVKKKNICIHLECKTIPVFNTEGNKNALYCASHKKDGMIDIKNKTCIYPDCKTLPNYNIAGIKNALYCAKHKLVGMVDVKNKTCIYPECKTLPAFNTEGIKNALYCKTHKLDGMIDIKHKYCVYPECKTRPNYNTEGNKNALYCAKHKLDEMVNIVNKTCIYPECKVRPTYNTEGIKNALYCASHKKDGMIDIKHTTCIYPDCKTRPTYNIEGEIQALYCAKHKLDKMVNIVSKTCKTYLCATIVKNKYDGYCLYCYINLFPDKPNSRNYKTKETAVVNEIQQSFPEFTWIADKKVKDGCSKRRPDLLLDMGSHIIIVEIDENKHSNYDCSCEHKRLMEISQDVNHRPIIFIRFNPDEYIQDDEIVVKSCWKLNKLGVMMISKNKQAEWDERIATLKQQIQYWIDNPTEKIVEIVELFY